MQNADDRRRTEQTAKRHRDLCKSALIFPSRVLKKSSPLACPDRLPPLKYPFHFEVRRISRNGGIRCHTHWVNVSHVLAEQYIGLEEIDDGLWTVYFSTTSLLPFALRSGSDCSTSLSLNPSE